MKQPVICIDGDYGSGNITVAGEIAKRLGIPCYIADDQPIQEQECLFLSSTEILDKLEKKKASALSQALQEQCVLAEMYVAKQLKESLDNVFTVYIQATLASRVSRVASEQNIPKMQAHRLVRNRDFGYHLPPRVRCLTENTDMSNYDYCIDTSKISFKEATDLIIAELGKRSWL